MLSCFKSDGCPLRCRSTTLHSGQHSCRRKIARCFKAGPRALSGRPYSINARSRLIETRPGSVHAGSVPLKRESPGSEGASGAMIARAIRAVAAIPTPPLAPGRGRRGNAWRVYRSQLVVLLEAMGGRLDKFRGRGGCHRCRWRICWLVQIVEFAYSNLLANNVDVSREEQLLHNLGGHPWKQAHNDGKEKRCPKRQSPKDLIGSLVEYANTAERRIDAGPEEDEKGADGNNQYKQPVPSILVDKNVGVDHDDGRTGHVNTHLFLAAEVAPAGTGKSSGIVYEVCHEEAHDGLIDTVNHIDPGRYVSRPTRSQGRDKPYQNFNCVHSSRRIPRR